MSTLRQHFRAYGAPKMFGSHTNFKEFENLHIPPSTFNPRKRGFHSTGLEDGNQDPTLGLPACKRSRSMGKQPRSGTLAVEAVTMSTARPKYALPKRRHISAVTAPTTPPPAIPTRAGVVRTFAIRLSTKPKRVRLNRRRVTRTRANSTPISNSDGQGAAVRIYTIKAPTAQHTAVLPWKFRIHEDTEDEERGIILSHSAGFLDISDDEARIAAKADVGKENAPALGYDFASVTSTIDPRVEMMVRPPLGELDMADYYTAADCNDDDEDEIL